MEANMAGLSLSIICLSLVVCSKLIQPLNCSPESRTTNVNETQQNNTIKTNSHHRNDPPRIRNNNHMASTWNKNLPNDPSKYGQTNGPNQLKRNNDTSSEPIAPTTDHDDESLLEQTTSPYYTVKNRSQNDSIVHHVWLPPTTLDFFDHDIGPIQQTALVQMFFNDFRHYDMSWHLKRPNGTKSILPGLINSFRQNTATGSGLGLGQDPAENSSTVDLLKDGFVGSPSERQTPRAYYGDALYSFHDAYVPVHRTLCVIICAFGAISNMINIIVLTRQNMLTPVNVILCGIATADLFVQASLMPYSIHQFSDQDDPTSFYSQNWARYTLLHSQVSVTAHSISVWLTCLLATWRYCMVCTSKQRTWSIQRAKLAILGVVGLVLVFCLPNYLSFDILSEIVYSDPSSATTNSSLASNSSNPNNASALDSKWTTIYKTGFSQLAEESQFLKTLNFWIFSCMTKIVPCVILTFFTTELIRTLLVARDRRMKLTTFGTQGRARDSQGLLHCETTCLAPPKLDDNDNNKKDPPPCPAIMGPLKTGCHEHISEARSVAEARDGQNEARQPIGSTANGAIMKPSNGDQPSERPASVLNPTEKIMNNAGQLQSSKLIVEVERQSNQQQHQRHSELGCPNAESANRQANKHGNNNNAHCAVIETEHVQLASRSNTSQSSKQHLDQQPPGTCPGVAENGGDAVGGDSLSQPVLVMSQIIVESSAGARTSNNNQAISTSMASTKVISMPSTPDLSDHEPDLRAENSNEPSQQLKQHQPHQHQASDYIYTGPESELMEARHNRQCLQGATSQRVNPMKQQLEVSLMALRSQSVECPLLANNLNGPNGKRKASMDVKELGLNPNREGNLDRRCQSATPMIQTERFRSLGSTTLAQNQSSRLMQAHQRGTKLTQNETTTKLLIAVMIVFLICEAPAGILVSLCALLGQTFFENVYEPLGPLTDLMALINSSVNFLLYCCMSQQFRTTFCQVILRCKGSAQA